MQQQSSFINSDRSQRKRSSSKKKGISVSLTPSKNQGTNNFDVSRVQTYKINDLPIVGYHSSAGKNLNSTQNYQRINFFYQSPAGSQVSQSQSKREQKFIYSQIAIDSVIKDQLNPNTNQANSLKFSPSNMFSNIELKNEQILKQNVQKGYQIRSNIFNIVEQIASKVYPKVKNQKQGKTNENQTFTKNKLPSKNNEAQQPAQTRSSKNKNSPKQIKLEMIAQCTLQTSDQLIRVNHIEAHNNDNILKTNNFSNNKNYQHMIKEQQRKRIERFKRAQEKLLKIIKVCDYGL